MNENKTVNTFSLEDAELLKQAAEEAVKYRIENFQHNKNVALSKRQFVSILQEIDPQLFENDDKDSDDFRLKQHYIGGFGLVKQLLSSLKKYKEGKDIKNKMDKVIGDFAAIIMILQYIGKLELAQEYLNKYGLEIKVKGFEEKYPDLARPDVKQTIVDCFEDAEKFAIKIEENQDIIKTSEFDKIPASLKFEKESNQSGITPNDFMNVVTIEAIAQLKAKKAKEKVEKLKDKNLAKSMSNMIVEHIASEIVKDIE